MTRQAYYTMNTEQTNENVLQRIVSLVTNSTNIINMASC